MLDRLTFMWGIFVVCLVIQTTANPTLWGQLVLLGNIIMLGLNVFGLFDKEDSE